MNIKFYKFLLSSAIIFRSLSKKFNKIELNWSSKMPL